MIRLLLLLTSVVGVSAVITECFYISDSLGGHNILSEVYCEHGCCGNIDNQKCCEPPGFNPWMVVAIVLGGVFLASVVVLAIYLIVRKQTKKHQRVGVIQATEMVRGDPTDLSVFLTQSSGGSPKPPEYSAIYNQHSPMTHIAVPPPEPPPEYSATDNFRRHSDNRRTQTGVVNQLFLMSEDTTSTTHALISEFQAGSF